MSVGEVAACCPTTELRERLELIAVEVTLARKAIIALELERRVIEDTLARRNGGGSEQPSDYRPSMVKYNLEICYHLDSERLGTA